jgi:hypothetical protein
VYFDLQRYSIDELVGIIKSHAAEQGAELRPVSAVEMAKRAAAEQIFQQETELQLRHPDGIREVNATVAALFDAFVSRVMQLHNDQAGWRPDGGYDHARAVVRMGYGSALLQWEPRHLGGSGRTPLVHLDLFDGMVVIPGRQEFHMPGVDVDRVRHFTFELARTPNLGWSWQPSGMTGSPMSSEDLAERCVKEFVGLVVRINEQRRRGGC